MPSPKTCETSCMDNPNLADMSLHEIEAFISDFGKEKYRAKQIMKWIYQRGVKSFAEMTDIAKDVRSSLQRLVTINMPEIQKIYTSSDGTKKILFRLKDGLFIESVIIPGKNHWTLCVSTQAGCQMGCKFCYTGLLGFKRNLVPSEITGQVFRCLFETPEGTNTKNIVMMGMGEPLANYENTLKAIKILTSDFGFGFSNRKITVSTCGITPMIERLGNDICVNLAISLNAADNRKRTEIMPINKVHPLETMLDACRNYPMPGRRMLTFEYILIANVNDSPDDAENLAKLLKGIRCKLNLIAFNEYPGSVFKRPSEDAILAFQKVLVKQHYTTIIRKSKGSDILAACGQLSGQEMNR